MPLKNSSSAAVAGSGEPPYDGGMEHRMTAIETRLDTILPTLATKADLAELRADMQKMHADIKTWTWATMITIIGILLAAVVGVIQVNKNTVPGGALAPQPPVIIYLPGSYSPAPPVSK